MLKATQLRPGMIIVHDGDLHLVHSVDHRTPGNKRGAMATRMRNLRNGSIMDYRFRAEDFVERAVLDEIEFQFLYADGEGYHFMNNESFEQIHVSGEVLGDAIYYWFFGDVLSASAVLAARQTGQNRFTLVREALREHLRQLETREREDRDRLGYLGKPQEASGWDAAAAWPE